MIRRLFPALLLATLATTPAFAGVSEAEAAKLGKELTPLGAEKAANADGSIPEWTGGLPKGENVRYPNPFKGDDDLFEIEADNVAEYADLLSEGHKALFRTYPDSYEMKVYPSRRSASYPQYIYDATRENATVAELVNEGNGVKGVARGFPFPIPKNGQEILWNHILRYRTQGFRGYVNRAITTTGGDYVIERAYIELAFEYGHPDATVENLDNQYGYAFTKIVDPPSKAGDAYLLHIPLDRVAEETSVWIFNPGQGRVRRIGDVGYDNPTADGLVTHDQIDMFNGPTDRYQVKLIGKKEMIIPYNGYGLVTDEYKYKDLIEKGHLDPDALRYEKHRVWIIEATVRPGMSHIYPKRVFYVDEDSWIIVMQDIYDKNGEFWRASEAFTVAFQNVPVMVSGVQVHYDFQSRRYVVQNLTSEEDEGIEYDWYEKKSYFTPSKLKKFASKRH